MNLFLLYEQYPLDDLRINGLLENRNSIYKSMKALSSSADNQKLPSLCANFRVKMKNGDTNKKPERFSKTT
jgi:hypothetical protein